MNGNKNYYIPSNISSFDHNLEETIITGVGNTQSDYEFAYRLYERVNRQLVYDINWIFLDEDLSNDIAKGIYNKSVSELSIDNNSVICKTWAETYAYLLTKKRLDSYCI